MKKTICTAIFTLAMVLGFTSNGVGADLPQDLLFSKYIEGSSYNKALEIYNGTPDSIDLSGYEIKAYHNGNTTPSYVIGLQGLLPAGDVFVICNPNANQDIIDAADLTDAGINFNGDDTIVLYHLNGDAVDALGQIGMDPGSEWGSGAVSTKDNTLVRQSSVCDGDTDVLDAFDPSLEWIGFDQDDTTNLGAHSVDCADTSADAVFIHEIQGRGVSSPMSGQIVTIEGIVVGDFQEEDQLRGFFIQEEDGDTDADPATSEGIFVYHADIPVNIGDKVRLTGTIAEYYGNTQIRSLTDLTVISSGNLLPGAADITLPLPEDAYLERYEGMHAVFNQTLTVTENYNLGRYGELVLSKGRLWNPTNVVTPGIESNAMQEQNDLNRIVLDDGATIQNPDPILFPSQGLSAQNTVRSGDRVQNVTGAIYFSYGVYRIQPTEPPAFIASNPRHEMPDAMGGSLKVSSFNVLNYFTTLDDGACPYAAGCRGADTADEFERQRAKIIAAMVAIDADIVGLMELENHPADESLQNLVDGLNDARGTDIYDYIPTGAIGTDAIKVALIYKSATVAPEGDFAILDASVDPRFNDTKNRPSLAQTFMEKATGERLTIVVNHLKSKGSNCDNLGDPDMGDGQGNCNQTRTAASEAMVDWLESDPTQSNDPDYLVIGDMNAYAMEDPITVFKDRNYTNLIDAYVGPDAYSYIFYGQAGYLDHALSNQTLTPQVAGVAEWHINCDEPRVLDYNTEYKSEDQLIDLYAQTAYRASDHDPVIIELNLASAQMTSVCSGLGDNRIRRFRDVDVYKLRGRKGDTLSLQLAAHADNPATEGRRALVMIAGGSQGARLLKINTGELPSKIKVTLPSDGIFYVTVGELKHIQKEHRFTGDYCLSVTSNANLSLDAARWVE